MENAGPLAEEAKLTTTNFKNVVNSMNMKNSKNSKNMNNMNNMNNALLRNIGVENTGLADKSYETSIGNLVEPSNFKEKKETKKEKANEVEAREIISLQSPNSSVMTVTPPLPDSNSDMVYELEPANKLSGGRSSRRSQGGLMSAMARTAYTLAPSAVLLATSYAMNKTRKNRKNRKTNRKNRKN